MKGKKKNQKPSWFKINELNIFSKQTDINPSWIEVMPPTTSFQISKLYFLTPYLNNEVDVYKIDYFPRFAQSVKLLDLRGWIKVSSNWLDHHNAKQL